MIKENVYTMTPKLLLMPKKKKNMWPPMPGHLCSDTDVSSFTEAS